MPDGFRGDAAANYLEAVSSALFAAATIHSRNPFQTLPNDPIQPHPQLPVTENVCIPHPPETARSGGYTVGLGSSGNIVVDIGEYTSILSRIKQADDGMGSMIYEMAERIKQMSESSFVLPQASSRVTAILSRVRDLLDTYASLADEATHKPRMFADQIIGLS